MALAFLTRIDRVSAVPAPIPDPPVVAAARAPLRPSAQPAGRRGGWLLPALFTIAVLTTVGYALISWDKVRVMLPDIAIGSGSASDLAPARTAQEPLIVPSSSATALDHRSAAR